MSIKQETLRTLLKLFPAGVLGSLLSGISAWRYITEVEPAQIEVTELHLPIRGLSATFAGLRLAQISDIHMGGWMNRERLGRAVQLALSARPDLFLLTGDYLPGYGWSPERLTQLADLSAGLRPLTSARPTFFILGNHDHHINAQAVRTALTGIGAIDLDNAVYPLEKDSARLYLAGVDDINLRRARLDLVLQQLPTNDPAILLAHEPDYADVSAATGRFALQISGHTHGGQVVLPFIGPPIRPRNGWKYPLGLYKVGDMYQYTNRGIGMSGKGFRYNCRPEITVFVLEESV
jgi:predicted MPP superfamily phosphohydrolase